MTIVRGSGRPNEGYRLKDGTPVDSVTTVIPSLGDGLKNWAYNMGYEDGWRRNKKDFRAHSQKSMSIGSAVHEMIEADIHAENVEAALSTYAEAHGMDTNDCWKARRCFGSWVDWKTQNDVEFLVTEMQLQSEEFGFGGTLDMLYRIGNKICLSDIKTSNKTYDNHYMQLAAYGILVDENDYGPVESYGVIRLSKWGGFHSSFLTTEAQVMTEARTAFLAALESHKARKRMREMM